MIAPATRALGRDAFYQVLDNGVFRILAAAALLPVLIFALVQVTPEQLRILWGVWEWPLATVAPFLGAAEGAVDLQAAVLGALIDTVFFVFAGTFGVLFCLVATAFFVPNMLNQGAADVLLHKPVSRVRFFLSRYVAGLLFVGMLAAVTATGVFAGVAVFSRFVDPGIFALVPALTYVFGIVFPVAVTLGVLTRNTVATILLSSVFFMGNGCIHNTWILWETVSGDSLREAAAEETLEESDLDETLEEGHWTDKVRPFLDAAHFALPKTSEVPYMTTKVRRAALQPQWAQKGATLQIGRLPDGWSPLEDAAPLGSVLVDEAIAGPVDFAARSETDGEIRVHLRPATTSEITRRNGTTRTVTERHRQAAETLVETLTTSGVAAGAVEVEYERTVRLPFQDSLEPEVESAEESDAAAPGEGDDGDEDEEPELPALKLGPGLYGTVVTWTEPGDDGAPARLRALVFKSKDEIVTVVHRSASDAPIDPGFALAVSRLGFGESDSAYGRIFTLDAPFRTNILQSILTSMAFAAVVLAIGAWRITRIDF